MGVYYQYVNYDRKECISLHYIANINYGAFVTSSIQSSVLNVFLGFSMHRSGLDLEEWEGRWKANRIELENDAEANDHEDEDWMDAGMEFIAWLEARGQLERFLEEIREGFWAPTTESVREGIATWRR